MAITMPDDVVLQIEDLHVSFRQEVRSLYAVNGVDLTIRKGETFGILGESGCGKSVTALSITRLVPCPPGRIDHGRIKLRCGDEIVDTATLDPKGRAIRSIRGRYASVIFQEPMRSLHPMYTVEWQIVEALAQHMNLAKKDARDRAVDLLRDVGIPQPERVAGEFPHRLSGGMRQRVMIAIARACDPSLLIADEPTTALDVTIQAQILELLQNVQQQNRMAMLLITHDLGVIAEMADRVAVMYLGKVVETATTRDLFTNPKHPYTQGLMELIPRPSVERKSRLYSLPGTVPEQTARPRQCVFVDRCPKAMDICRTTPPPNFGDGDHVARCWLYGNGNPGHNRPTENE